MLFTTTSSLKERSGSDVLVLPFWQGKKKAEAAAAMQEFASLLEIPIGSGDFLGKEGELLVLYAPKANSQEKRIALLGLGEETHFQGEALRRAYAKVVKLAQNKKYKHLSLLVPEKKGEEKEALCEIIAEGALLANYTFDKLKKDPSKHVIEKCAFIGVDKKTAQRCKKVSTVAAGVAFTRDLVNGNADDVNPDTLVQTAQDLKKTYPALKVTVLRKKELEKEKMGLLLAVARGAFVEPALIVLEYMGDPKSKEVTAIVGKGITFDTGGLNLKPTGGMETMKCDMAGAAAVLGIMRTVAELKLKVNLIGVVATTENAIGPLSYKPGDVYRSHSGKTVEISNTDAEGRLVLADAFSFVQTKFKPTRLIDLATLTGGIVVALGEGITGFFSNEDKLSSALIESGEKTQERVWRMPLIPDYREQLKSSIADIKNAASGRKGSAATAAAFLKEFIFDDLPWAHLDIAGTAYLSDPKHYHQTPATGVGVRLLLNLLEK